MSFWNKSLSYLKMAVKGLTLGVIMSLATFKVIDKQASSSTTDVSPSTPFYTKSQEALQSKLPPLWQITASENCERTEASLRIKADKTKNFNVGRAEQDKLDYIAKSDTAQAVLDTAHEAIKLNPKEAAKVDANIQKLDKRITAAAAKGKIGLLKREIQQADRTVKFVYPEDELVMTPEDLGGFSFVETDLLANKKAMHPEGPDAFRYNLEPFVAHLAEVGDKLLSGMAKHRDLMVDGVPAHSKIAVVNKHGKVIGMESSFYERVQKAVETAKKTGGFIKSDAQRVEAEKLCYNVYMQATITMLHVQEHSDTIVENVARKYSALAKYLEKRTSYVIHNFGHNKAIELSQNLDKPVDISPAKRVIFGLSESPTGREVLFAVASRQVGANALYSQAAKSDPSRIATALTSGKGHPNKLSHGPFYSSSYSQTIVAKGYQVAKFTFNGKVVRLTNG